MKKLIISMLLCLGFVFLISGCTSEASPEEIVNGFLEAFVADDLDGAMTYFADDAVFNAVNVGSEYQGKEDISNYIEFRMGQIIGMETRDFSVDGNEVTWEASLERTSSPTEISYSAIVEAGKISYLETNQILDDDQ